jgi:hypothetical protein
MEKIFEKYFQKDISLYIKDDLIKKGKFLLIKNCIVSNNFFFELTIKRGNKLDLLRIPYPFNLEEHIEEELIYMDYRLDALFKNKPNLKNNINEWISQLDVKAPNKLFNNILEIKFE